MVDEYPNDITDCELFMTTSAACNNYSMQKVLYTRKIHVLNMYWSCNRFFFWPLSAISALIKLSPFSNSLLIYSEPSRCSPTTLSLGSCDNLQLNRKIFMIVECINFGIR